MSSVLDCLPATAPLMPWPAAAPIGVRFYPGERRDVQRTARRLFGRTLWLWEYAGLAGAVDDARVELGTLGGGLYLETCDPVAHCYRAVQRVRRVGSGPVLVIEAFCILPRRMRRRGLGLRMLGRQLAFAKRLGVLRIETTAGRRGDENGYYTWPRYGFNGPLPTEIGRILPPRLHHAQSVLDLIQCDYGRHWWSEHGTTLDVAFDLADRSRCWRVFDRYVREKSRGGERLPVA